MKSSPERAIGGLLFTAFLMLFGIVTLYYQVGYVERTEWQVHQSVFTGALTIHDQPGPYWRCFGKVWECPHLIEGEFTRANGKPMKTTFNDVGYADLDCYLRLDTPTTREERLKIHKDFASADAILRAVGKHMATCVSVTGPVMSASEHQSSRKNEFNQLVQEQLSRGEFATKSTTIELEDLAEVEQTADGKVVAKKAKVNATIIVTDKDGKYVVQKSSPLIQYGLKLNWFSVPEASYDARTQELFAKKKESFLRAEQSKADRQTEIAKRLEVEESGRRQVAEVQARENQKKEEAIIQAEQRAEVAKIAKQEAITKASQLAEVAEQNRLVALKAKEIAQIEAETAELAKRKVIAEAEARQKSLQLGGGISEKDRVLAEIESKTRIGVAEHMSKRMVPRVVIGGMGVDEKGEMTPIDLTTTLMNMRMIHASGLLDKQTTLD